MKKKILLGIIIMVIGIGILPQTVALFAGQHDWYDTTQSGNQVPCEKCHSDINTELSQPGTTNAIHKVMGCEQCHVTAAPNSEGIFQGPGRQFHAAATAACIDCHNTTLLYGTFQHTPEGGRGGKRAWEATPARASGKDRPPKRSTGPEEVH